MQVDPLEPRFETLPFARKIPSSHSRSVKEGIVTEPDTVPTPLAERREKKVGVHVPLYVIFLYG